MICHVRRSAWPGWPFEKERIGLLSIVISQSAVSVTYHLQPVRCVRRSGRRCSVQLYKGRCYVAYYGDVSRTLELLKISMFGGVRSRLRWQTQTTEQTATCLSAQPLGSCILDCRFALCYLITSFWQTLSRRAANATPSAIVACTTLLSESYFLSRTVSKLLLSIGQIFAFNRGVLLFNALVIGNVCECHHKSYCQKLITLGYTFCCRQYGSNFNNFDVYTV